MNEPSPGPDSLLVTGELGSGALATVFRFEGPDGEVLAGKVLHASHLRDAGAVDRFRREAELSRDLRHPNVVAVYGMATHEGRPTLLMELVEGPTLAARIAAAGRLEPATAVAIAIGIARGLAAAHAEGVVHRDLKPANILLTGDDVPKIADFGMARATSLGAAGAGATTVVGTPDYMAPESTDPVAVDPRTDLYALGCILFEMLSGRPPFAGATPFAILEAHTHDPIPPLPKDVVVPTGLLDILHGLLAKSPADRPQAAEVVAESLTQLQPSTGLALRTAATPVPSSQGRCARCRAPLVPGLRVCLECGLDQAHLQSGTHSLFVTGPGELGAKLDTALRERLLRWIDDNPALGLDPGPLRRAIPRLPFLLVRGLDERSAQALRGSLQHLGLVTEHTRGGAWSLPAMRKKARTMGGRAAGIFGGSVGYVGIYTDMTWLMLLVPAAILGTFVSVAGLALRRFTRDLGTRAGALPEVLAERLEKVATVGPAIEARRHRRGLKAVVARALGARRALGEADAKVDQELAEAIDVALVAAARLDALDRDLSAQGVVLHEARGELRDKLQERDLWAARLLDLTATLDGLRGRLAAANAGQGARDDADALSDLRARVDALEEVQGT